MLNENNIAFLGSQLLAIGFPSYLGRELRLHICLGPSQFSLRYRQDREGDVMNYLIYFQHDAALGQYRCSYYEACLRKRIEIQPTIVNDMDVKDLEQRMGVVNWIRLIGCLENTDDSSNLSREQEENMEGIVLDLVRLSATVEGTAIANLLKVKFWAETPLGAYCTGMNSIKSSYEISQRFYFFEGEEQITLDEAYRFLCHRLRERKLNAKEKDPGNPASSQIRNKENGAKEGSGQLKKRSGKGAKSKM